MKKPTSRKIDPVTAALQLWRRGHRRGAVIRELIGLGVPREIATEAFDTAMERVREDELTEPEEARRQLGEMLLHIARTGPEPKDQIRAIEAYARLYGLVRKPGEADSDDDQAFDVQIGDWRAELRRKQELGEIKTVKKPPSGGNGTRLQ